jgi:hypothetical protein
MRTRLSVRAAGALLILTGVVAADERRRAGGWLVSTRVALPSLSAIDAETREAGFSEFSSPEVLIGPGVELSFGRSRVGVELVLDPYRTAIERSAGETASRSFSMLVATVGYDVVRTTTVGIYPLVTLGGARAEVTLTPGAAPILVDRLQAFTDRTDVSRVAFVGAAGLGADVLVPLSTTSPEGRRLVTTREGIRFGVDVSYFVDIAETGWSRGDTDLGSGPSGTIGGAQGRFAVG